MEALLNQETYWLTMTNVVLGLVTLACVGVLGVAVAKEVFVRMRSRVLVPIHDDHTFALGDLGITMADGGKPIDEKELHNLKNGEAADESNIFRSEN